MLSSLVPNASGRLDIEQCRSNAGKKVVDFGMHSATPGIRDSNDTAGSCTARMILAPSFATIGT